MAVMTKNLVLRGVRVVSDVVTDMERAGLNTARMQTGAMSHSPQVPHGSCPAGSETRLAATDIGAAKAVFRAGRLERQAGLPGRRLAITAGQTILSRWSRYSPSYSPSQRGQQRPLWLKREQAATAFTGLECTRRPLGERGAC